MNIDELTEAVESLTERVEQLETELEEERERRRHVEEELERERDRADDLRAELDDLGLWRENISRWKDHTRDRIEEIEETVEAASKVEESDVIEADGDSTPMEQIVALPEQLAKEQLDNAAHRNTYRARHIAANWADYCEQTPRGPLLRSTDAKTVLTAHEEDGRIRDTNTVRRVFERLETLSRGAWTVEKDGRDRWVVVLDEPAELARPDAVVTGGR
jgi:hypothetical protein